MFTIPEMNIIKAETSNWRTELDNSSNSPVVFPYRFLSIHFWSLFTLQPWAIAQNSLLLITISMQRQLNSSYPSPQLFILLYCSVIRCTVSNL